jgi:hypothetical protein
MNPIVAAFVLLLGSSLNEWEAKTKDFHAHEMIVERDNHSAFIAADRPIRCQVFRAGQVIQGHAEGYACLVKWQSVFTEKVTVFVYLDLNEKPEMFQIHGRVF